jgi:glycolate oxidase iron-sulfur subunit
MQTSFTAEQLQNPRIAEADGILRKCVHCGFCTATCPTYVLLGDERDSPRGRIYMIKGMLERGEKATEETARHVDRCLSCLACMTTCPSGVNYMHLIDQARVHVEQTYDRPIAERFMRWLLATVMPSPKLFRLALLGAGLGRPFKPVVSALGFKRLDAMLGLAPNTLPRPRQNVTGFFPTTTERKGHVSLLRGCAQSVLDQGINDATVQLLNRLGYDVQIGAEANCCGSLTHHMGREKAALASARGMVDQWTEEAADAIIITSSGCGTTIKDYGHMFRDDPAYAAKAAAVAAKAFDITEFLWKIDLPQSPVGAGLRVAYHSACSLQHGQNIKTLPQQLLKRAGFDVADVPEGHLCCGSAGTYNMLQPEISRGLRDRKVENIRSVRPQIIAAGNLGCMTQIGQGIDVPIVHTVALLNWAYGGDRPEALTSLEPQRP